MQITVTVTVDDVREAVSEWLAKRGVTVTPEQLAVNYNPDPGNDPDFVGMIAEIESEAVIAREEPYAR